jgi:hypothetical protein
MASCGMIHVPIFMKISRGVQAKLKFCLRNLKVYNVAINDVIYGLRH